MRAPTLKSRPIQALYVLYDRDCAFCRRCRAWLSEQTAYIRLEFIPFQAPDLSCRFPGIERFRVGEKLAVVADDGSVYQGEAALLMCLYALRDYRSWSHRLAGPGFRGMVGAFFEQVSRHRKAFSRFLDDSSPMDPQSACACDNNAQKECS